MLTSEEPLYILPAPKNVTTMCACVLFVFLALGLAALAWRGMKTQRAQSALHNSISRRSQNAAPYAACESAWLGLSCQIAIVTRKVPLYQQKRWTWVRSAICR